MMGLATQLAKAGVKKAAKSSSSLTDLVKNNSVAKSKEITPQEITEYIKTTLIPKKESDKNFKSKFKDTTVVDEKNKPRVMYHGRNKDFESFDTGNVKTDTQEIGTHIGTADQANEFATREGGNVVPTYLDVKNPLRLNDYGSFGSGEVLEQLRSTGKFNEDLLDEIESIPSIVERNKAVVDLIKSDGYDGIVYLNKREGLNLKGTEKQKSEKIDELQDYDDGTLIKKYGAKDSYIIFDPSQAKSIFNKGSWSGSDDRLNYNKGGTVKDMNTLFAEGGMNEEGGTVDPVSGNEVPAGSLQKEVRDDIPAQLSEGEFVLPADVVRYIGLDRLMKIRDKAKEGLARMEEIGQMGNAEQAESPEEPHGDEFASEIDSIMSELDSEGGENNLAVGGMPTPSTGFQVKQFKTPDGSSMFVTFINGEPATTIPEGAQEVNIANQAQKDQASLTSTERAIGNKSNIGTKEKMLSSIENVDQRFEKMFDDKIAEMGRDRKNQKAINENIPVESRDFKSTDSELSIFSEAADYRLTDGMEDTMLSGSMNQAAAAPDLMATSPAPTSLDTIQNSYATGPELAMAKGGLVARRKK